MQNCVISVINFEEKKLGGKIFEKNSFAKFQQMDEYYISAIQKCYQEKILKHSISYFSRKIHFRSFHSATSSNVLKFMKF